MNIEKYVKNGRMLKAILGVDYKEFVELTYLFDKTLSEAQRNKPNRQRKPGAGQKGVLKTSADKLFFTLFYLKVYPTFDCLAIMFNRHRGRSCEDIHRYIKILETVLKKKLVLPERKINSVEEFIQKFPEVKDVFPDGTERRIQRPKDERRNRKTYSGKKKTHTRKNIVVSDNQKKILILSPTKSGRRHDKRLADKILLFEHIPKDVAVWADTGFTGITHIHSNSFIPKKASRGRPLTEEEKKDNKIISSLRCVAEHAIAGMKRFGILIQTLRNKIGEFDDLVTLICAGLWNLHLKLRD